MLTSSLESEVVEHNLRGTVLVETPLSCKLCGTFGRQLLPPLVWSKEKHLLNSLILEEPLLIKQ